MNAARYLPLALALGPLFSCNGQPLPDLGSSDRNDDGVVSVFVSVTDGNRGTVQQPVPYSSDGVTYTMHIEARGADDMPLANFNDFVNVSVNPGVLDHLEMPGHPENVQGRNVRLTNGVADVRVTFARAYGETRVWVEDQGYQPVDLSSGATPQCADGMDNDHDGRTDYPGDYGCAAPNDDSEAGGSYALGASEPVYFNTPRIYDVQGGGMTSPLVNDRISVTQGTLIVTRVDITGFWVTDIADRSCNGMPCYNSIYAFNFRLPDGLRVCDRLSLVQGTVSEFVGTTQFGQPAWTIDPNGGLWINTSTSGPCQIPDAVELTAAQISSASTQFEQYESSLVRVSDVLLSHDVGPANPTCDMTAMHCDFGPGHSNCDFNNNNQVDFTNPLEALCANQCQTQVGCSEWTNWVRFGQLAVDFAMNQPTGVTRLIISPRTALSDFDPLNPRDASDQPIPADQHITATGTLKQVGPNWIIEPRCTDDLVTTGGAPLPANHSCISPRADDTGGM